VARSRFVISNGPGGERTPGRDEPSAAALASRLREKFADQPTDRLWLAFFANVAAPVDDSHPGDLDWAEDLIDAHAALLLERVPDALDAQHRPHLYELGASALSAAGTPLPLTTEDVDYGLQRLADFVRYRAAASRPATA
jgi:hypothetical protein